MKHNHLDQTLSLIAGFYDACKVGYKGTEGYRKSTDLQKFIRCSCELEAQGVIDRQKTSFLDLGCADGRVNVLMSYFVKHSIGIEIDSTILDEYGLLKDALTARIKEADLTAPPENIHLFNGSSLEEQTYRQVKEKTGVGFDEIDIFYTYITLHDLFGEKIGAEAKKGAYYLVYGFSKILPRYDGLELLIPDVASQGIAALYRKV
jgi:hypothetical protein